MLCLHKTLNDIATLNPAISATSVINAVNELYSQIAFLLAINITDNPNTETVEIMLKQLLLT